MEEEDFDSDTSDEDYVPTGGVVSEGEEDLSGSDAEEDDEDAEEPEENDGKSKGSKKRKRGTGANKKKAKRKTKKKEEPEPKPVPEPPVPEQHEEDKTKRADSLWADFMKDVGGITPKSKSVAASTAVNGDAQAKPSQAPLKPVETKPEKVVITKVYEFAGEEVRVTKEVEANSEEAKEALSAPSPSVVVVGSSITAASSSSAPSSSSPAGAGGPKRPLAPARGGLASLASILGAKRDKISTLEKSKLDWDNFKKAENIEEELKVFNQGKSGYLERQDFLERTDLKQFEIERNLRLNRRSNR